MIARLATREMPPRLLVLVACRHAMVVLPTRSAHRPVASRNAIMTRIVSVRQLVVGGVERQERRREVPQPLVEASARTLERSSSMRDRISSSPHRHINFNLTKMRVLCIRIQKTTGVDHVSMSSTCSLAQRHIIDAYSMSFCSKLSIVEWLPY